LNPAGLGNGGMQRRNNPSTTVYHGAAAPRPELNCRVLVAEQEYGTFARRKPQGRPAGNPRGYSHRGKAAGVNGEQRGPEDAGTGTPVC